jgi:hypothetical protein
MATERATGIAGNQGSRRASATESREATKGRLKKIAPWFAGILVVLAILTWWKNLPEEKVADNTVATQPGKVAVPVAPAVGNSSRQVFAVTETEWSTPTRVVNGTCFKAWAEKFGSPREKVQVSTLENPTIWADLDGYAGMPIAWVRVGSRGPGPTEVIVEVRPDGQCK